MQNGQSKPDLHAVIPGFQKGLLVRFLNLIRIAVFVCLLSAPVQAEPGPIAGESDPNYQAMVSLWLAGQDLRALTGLGQLSRDGNRAAQILLARIASNGRLHAHVTSAMPRKERVRLLRLPEGLSGRSWLFEAMAEIPLAAAFLQSARAREKADAITALYDGGETDTAMLTGRSLLLQNDPLPVIDALLAAQEPLTDDAWLLLGDALEMAGDTATQRYAGAVALSEGAVTGARRDIAILTLTPPAPQAMVSDPAVFQSVERHSLNVEAWTPIRQFCDANCADSSASCTAVGASLMSRLGAFAMRSPSQRLLPNETYWSSNRIEADLARSFPQVERVDPDIRALNQCFFDAMTAAQAVHGHGT